MAVKIGSARISENGSINGVKGDQTHNEVSTQDWYLHTKGWVCIRPKDANVAEKIAKNMQSICDNQHFGYGQGDRDSSLVASKPYGYDASKVTVNCNIDCSLAVLLCCLYAGVSLKYDSNNAFYTGNIATRLKATGMFDILESAEYCTKSDNLKRGDILCTKVKGHVVVVLSNGSNVSVAPTPTPIKKDEPVKKEVTATKYAECKDASLAGKYTVTTRLYLRNGAGAENKALVVMPKGTVVNMYGYYSIASTKVKWFYVQFNMNGIKYTGFCSSKYLKKN